MKKSRQQIWELRTHIKTPLERAAMAALKCQKKTVVSRPSSTSWPRGMTIIVLTFCCCRGRCFFLVNRKTRHQTLKTNRTSSAKLKRTHWNTQLKQNSVGTIDFCQTTKIYVQREQSTTRKESERKRERKKICHICQTQSKSSKRARNVKLMALNLHRNRRRHKQQQKKK